MVQVDEKLYLLGGRGIKPIEIYDPKAGTWTNGAHPPMELHHFQAVEVDGLVYAVGAYTGGFPYEESALHVFVYDPQTDRWSIGPRVPAARARGAAGAVARGGKIYVAGGIVGGHGAHADSKRWFDELDPATGAWRVLPDLPRARDHFSAVVVGDKLYAVGGRDTGVDDFFDNTIAEVDVYDFATETWSTLPPMSNLPTERAAPAVAAIDEKIYVIGGEGFGRAFDTAEVLDTTTGVWEPLPALPTPRHSAGSAVCFGGIFIASGAETQGGRQEGTAFEAFFPLGAIPDHGWATRPSFGKSPLWGVDLHLPTTLQFGPDGRLYVAQQYGDIKVLTIHRDGPNRYSVTATEIITALKSIPNHNDDGIPSPRNDRQVTGLLVSGTAASPVIYASSSDPRIGAGARAGDLELDTNSGVISRLTPTGSGWTHLQLVRGLPRSAENHSSNGLQLAEGILYLAQGGNTNQGAPSISFALLPEFALSAAILAIDLKAIGDRTYDLPTLQGTRLPFGGQNGANQAILEAEGPVTIHAPGFRNPYDLVITARGRMYVTDNGANPGWGEVPIGAGPGGLCTNDANEPGAAEPDSLHYVSGPGYYGGHPNPTRGNPSGSGFARAVPSANPIECDHHSPGSPQSGAIATFGPWGQSTNGIAEYRATNFGGAMRGDLLAASFDNSLYRFKLSSSGDSVVLEEQLFQNIGERPLDVTTLGDHELFPGTIWVADHAKSKIFVFEPNDFGGLGEPCTGEDDPGRDEDGDGFTNADEIDNGTNPCSAGDVPPDVDGDLVSDLNDPDDDNDGLDDTIDPFAIDPANGNATSLPVRYTWDNDGPPAGGLLGLGFTGLMTSGIHSYSKLFDPGAVTAGGAAGVLTVHAVGAGDARGESNDQAFGFQFGVAVDRLPFTARTRILAPFAGLAPTGNQSMGLFIGPGDQDNFARLVVTAAGGAGAIELAVEIGGTYVVAGEARIALPGPEHIDLFLTVDPGELLVRAAYTVDAQGHDADVRRIRVGEPVPVPRAWFEGKTGVAVGIISTSSGGPPFPASWDFIEVEEEVMSDQ